MNSTIVNNNIEDTFPVSDQQQRMIKFIGGRTDSYYSMIESFILNGPLDIQALKTALIRVLDRHDVLRAIYPEEHQVYKLVGSGLDIIDIIWNEEKDIVFPSCEDALATGIEALTLPMKLDVEPPLRTWLTRVGNNSTVLIVCGHHLVFDAWTFMLFYEDLENNTIFSSKYAATRPLESLRESIWCVLLSPQGDDIACLAEPQGDYMACLAEPVEV